MRVLYFTHRLPYAPNRGDRLRAYHQLLEMRRWAEVHLISLVHSEDEAAQVAQLGDVCASVRIARVHPWRTRIRAGMALAGTRPLTHVMLDSRELRPAIAAAVQKTPPDLVFSYCTGVAHVAFQAPLDRLPLVVDFVDVDSAKWSALGNRSSGPMSWVYRREARHLATFERAVAGRAAATLVVNRREANALTALAPGASTHVIPNGVDLDAFMPPGPPRSGFGVVLTGVLNYPPNVEGALWFARTVWPTVRAAVPEAHLTLAGADPTREIRQLASADTGITVTGTVPDIRDYLWSHQVAVAPLFTARGVQNKVLEAVAAGLPCVVTSVVRDGLPPEVLRACSIADDPASFAAEVVQLLSLRPEQRRERAAAAELAKLRWRERLAPLESIVRDALRSPAAQRAHAEPRERYVG